MKIKTLLNPKKWNILFSSSSSSKESPDLVKKSKSKKRTDRLAHDVSVTFRSDLSESISSASHQRKHSNINSRTKSARSRSSKRIPATVEEYQSPNEKIVAEFLGAWNRHSSLEETLSFFASNSVQVKFEDTPSITAGILAAEHDKLYKSFPDILFRYEAIREDRLGLVLVEELQVSGTHTGDAYGFGPFPPVPKSNRHVVNDPERLWFSVENGKITLMEVISLGDVTGPAGFYVQVGGKLSDPRPPVGAPTSIASKHSYPQRKGLL